MINLKEKLKNKNLTRGSWITIGHPSIAEIMVKAGFDWLAVDMEHSAITLEQAQTLIQVIELGGCVPLVRVEENNPSLIKRVMDTGAYGVIVPMVNTRDDAIKAVKAVRYPPEGTRGVGLARAQGYGMEFERYKNWVNKESIVIVQIEHIKAVENLEAIFEVEGVDGFIVGPYDLSGSISRPGEFEHAQVKSALRRILGVAKSMNKTAGFHVIYPSLDKLQEKMEEGYKFLAFSLDTLFLGNTCQNFVKKIKELNVM